MAFRALRSPRGLDLFLQELSGDGAVAGHEDASASFRLSITPRWKDCSSAAPSAENFNRCLIFLARQLHQVLVDDVADMLEIDGEGDDLHGAARALLVQASRVIAVT